MENITSEKKKRQGDAEKFLSSIGKKIDELTTYLPKSAEKAKHQVGHGIEELKDVKHLLEREVERLKSGEVSEQEFETKFGASLNDLKAVTNKIRNRFFEENKQANTEVEQVSVAAQIEAPKEKE